MVNEQFIVQPLYDSEVALVVVALLAIGVVLLLACLLVIRIKRGSSYSDVYQVLTLCFGIVGIALVCVSGFLYYGTHNSPSSMVTIGDGYINVESTYFVGVGVNGDNKNVTSEEIAAAFVGQVGSGDFKLRKQHGLNYGDVNVGRYTLGNGATAYIASTSSTNLIIHLKSGQYLIVGNQDTQAIANSFSQNVYKLTKK
jgi:hypothetical protein